MCTTSLPRWSHSSLISVDPEISSGINKKDWDMSKHSLKGHSMDAEPNTTFWSKPPSLPRCCTLCKQWSAIETPTDFPRSFIATPSEEIQSLARYTLLRTIRWKSSPAYRSCLHATWATQHAKLGAEHYATESTPTFRQPQRTCSTSETSWHGCRRC